MKLILCFLLIAGLLLCVGCSGEAKETVPTYSAPETEQIPTSELPTSTQETQPKPTGIVIDQPDPNKNYATTDAAKESLRLQWRHFYEGGKLYDARKGFAYCSTDDSAAAPLCQKEHCPHLDKNCNAYLFDLSSPYGYDHIRFGYRNDVLYIAALQEGKLTVRSTNIVTGEKKTYLTAEAEEGQTLHLGEVYVADCGVFVSYALGVTPSYSTYFYFYDFASGELQLLYGSPFSGTPNVWGLTNDGKLFYTVTYSGNDNRPFYDGHYDSSYSEYLHHNALTNLICLDIYKQPWHGEHITGSGVSEDGMDSLLLGEYDCVLDGVLYYASYGILNGYELETGKWVEGPNLWVKDFRCLDGRIFIETREGEYLWYIPETSSLPGAGTYQSYDPTRCFVPEFETAELLYGKWGGKYYSIEKTAFYRGEYDTAIIREDLESMDIF